MRRQLQERVVRYRTRQDNPTLALPFEEEPEPAPKILAFPAPPVPVEEEVRVSRSGPLRENRGSEGAATPAPAPQPILEFQSGALQEQAWRIRPVAPLRLRVSGHLKDMQIIAGAAILFLAAMAVIPYFGVTVHPNLILLSGMVCGSLLLTLLFGLLFVWGAGVTPGMKSAGLRLVNFDGMPASRWQRLWRVLGAIVSAGSFFIGYLWAVVDEETLYWHDHISKTYLTRSDP
ncbi:MAG: RDD family protein [Acidobacteria bacterium]|nr:RDD family protein [Acidobacteriota bacterium]